jgi:hypothetical protein
MKKILLLSLLAFNTQIKAQNVGIGNPSPAEKLDVTGNINVTGTIKANGVDGTAGQLLQNNGNGTLSWVGKEHFKNFRVYRYEGVDVNTLHTFIYPSGVTEVGVEIWGGGGQSVTSGGGAASGGYICAIIPGSFASLNLVVGAGGGGCTGCVQTGNSSSVSKTSSFVLTARGGYNMNYSTPQGTFSASGTYIPNISYFGVNGGSAKTPDIFYENTPDGYYTFQRNAAGADAPFRTGTGGRSGFRRMNWNGTNSIDFTGADGSEPGGGGGFPNGKGGHGQIIVYW